MPQEIYQTLIGVQSNFLIDTYMLSLTTIFEPDSDTVVIAWYFQKKSNTLEKLISNYVSVSELINISY